jgi:hypothetical protein
MAPATASSRKRFLSATPNPRFFWRGGDPLNPNSPKLVFGADLGALTPLSTEPSISQAATRGGQRVLYFNKLTRFRPVQSVSDLHFVQSSQELEFSWRSTSFHPSAKLLVGVMVGQLSPLK